ncbi:MAG: porin family protein [Afipia sp.]|nr:porin family protein [Afipia sp.]OJW65529.1 MAG: cell envelope biogenesis protein OmpA [Afipia sp. 64-13]
MRSVKPVLAAAAVSLLSSAAFAADLPLAPPPYAPPPPADFGGWYLRGDIGMTNQRLKKLDSATAQQNPGMVDVGMGFDSSPLFGVGVGYQFNSWFRADVTGQYRGRANFHGSNPLIFSPTSFQSDNYSGSKSEALFMINAYADLGTWWCVTPFVGVGVGTSYNMISGFRDDNIQVNGGVTNASVATFADRGSWNFAWAAHAGLGYKVSPSLTLELAYSYVNLGSARPGAYTLLNGSGGPSSIVMKDITSHDVKFGVRWAIDPGPAYLPPPPLVTKG